MKILFLNNFFYLRGGSEKVLFEEMRVLHEAGHEVAIYARSHEKNEPTEFMEFFPPELNTESLNVSIETFRTVKELIYSGTSRRGLRQVIGRFRPDIAHAHNIYGRLSLSVLDELKSSGIPVVMTLHDLKPICPSYLMLNAGKVCERCKGGKYYNAFLSRCHKESYPASFVYALETWINHAFGKYRQVDRFVTPSRFLRDKIIEHGWTADRIAYIPNFVDSLYLPPHRSVGACFLYIGRLSREKGVGTLIKAYSRLEKPIPLKIVGDGPEREALEKDVRVSGIPATFTGYLSGAALEEALDSARAVVMPSEWYENAPLSLLEAFARGKPVIGSRIGGIPEMIDEGVNGYLFEPGDVAGLMEKLETLSALTDEKAMAMGRSAQEKVKRDFSRYKHLEQLTELYQCVLGASCA